MKEEDLILKLKKEGFTHVFTHTDHPGATYGDHTHPGVTAHIVLSGEIIVNIGGKDTTYRAGERFDVDAGEVHSARIGNSGCRYIIGEK